RYFFRVTASDREVNPPASAREAELVSVPVLIDNSQPLVNVGAPRRSGGAIELGGGGNDARSPPRGCVVFAGCRPWVHLEASDGVIDSPRESFRVHLESVAAGEHVIVIRAVDSAGNAGLAKVVIR